MSKSIIRSIKNVTNGYSVAEVKVRNDPKLDSTRDSPMQVYYLAIPRLATSNDEYPPSPEDLRDIADMTYNKSLVLDLQNMIERRLNDKGKNWLHVCKALDLVTYLLEYGSDDMVVWARRRRPHIKTLREFVYMDDLDNSDKGKNVRSKAKELYSLLDNEEGIRTLRASTSHTPPPNRMPYSADLRYPGSRLDRGNSLSSSRRPDAPTRTRTVDNDPEIQAAIQESKLTASEEESRRRERDYMVDENDEDLKRAIFLSEQEALQKKQQEQQLNSPVQAPTALYGYNNSAGPSVPSYMTTSQPSSLQPEAPKSNADLLIDIFGNTPTVVPMNQSNPPVSSSNQFAGNAFVSQPYSSTTFSYESTTQTSMPSSVQSGSASAQLNSTSSPFAVQSTYGSNEQASSYPYNSPFSTNTLTSGYPTAQQSFASPANAATNSNSNYPIQSSTSPFAPISQPHTNSTFQQSTGQTQSSTNPVNGYSPFSSDINNTSQQLTLNTNSPFSRQQPTQFQQQPQQMGTYDPFLPQQPMSTGFIQSAYSNSPFQPGMSQQQAPASGYGAGGNAYSNNTNAVSPFAAPSGNLIEPTKHSNNPFAYGATAPPTPNQNPSGLLVAPTIMTNEDLI
ncbi:ENTH domain-containing protein [Lipomyces oligophaga]|uniref:ENTH domain-containing protein n=1 Tax=Lipomyces oligophaga TaxID=45792 RepID=UPI0034CF45C0